MMSIAGRAVLGLTVEIFNIGNDIDNSVREKPDRSTIKGSGKKSSPKKLTKLDET